MIYLQYVIFLTVFLKFLTVAEYGEFAQDCKRKGGFFKCCMLRQVGKGTNNFAMVHGMMKQANFVYVKYSAVITNCLVDRLMICCYNLLAKSLSDLLFK